MKRSIVLYVALCFAWFSANAWAGRNTTKLPPQQVLIKSGQGDTYIYSGKNASGNVVWEVGTEGKPGYPPKDSYANVSFNRQSSTGVTSYTVSTSYNTYIIDTTVSYGMGTGNATANGVSVYLPAGSATLDGAVFKFVNITPSGNTGFAFIPANDAKRRSGITDWVSIPTGADGVTTGVTRSTATNDSWLNNVCRGPGSAIALMYRYVSATGGTWYQVSGTSPWY